jgi:hypothetical protein
MPKRDIASLPPPTVFLTLEELAARWRRATITTEKLAHKLGIPAHRLTSMVHLYAISDIEKVEAAARVKPTRVTKSAYKAEVK